MTPAAVVLLGADAVEHVGGLVPAGGSGGPAASPQPSSPAPPATCQYTCGQTADSEATEVTEHSQHLI